MLYKSDQMFIICNIAMLNYQHSIPTLIYILYISARFYDYYLILLLQRQIGYDMPDSGYDMPDSKWLCIGSMLIVPLLVIRAVKPVDREPHAYPLQYRDASYQLVMIMPKWNAKTNQLHYTLNHEIINR